MNFISFAFAALLVAVMAVRFSLGREKRGATYLGTLLLASLVFYAWHVPVYLPLLLLSAATDFEAGRRLIFRLDADRMVWVDTTSTWRLESVTRRMFDSNGDKGPPCGVPCCRAVATPPSNSPACK